MIFFFKNERRDQPLKLCSLEPFFFFLLLKIITSKQDQLWSKCILARVIFSIEQHEKNGL